MEYRPEPKAPQQGTLIKTSSDVNPLVDYLMRLDTPMIYKDEDTVGHARKAKAHTASKGRALLQKLKKL